MFILFPCSAHLDTFKSSYQRYLDLSALQFTPHSFCIIILLFQCSLYLVSDPVQFHLSVMTIVAVGYLDVILNSLGFWSLRVTPNSYSNFSGFLQSLLRPIHRIDINS